jgi:hypothetical protein
MKYHQIIEGKNSLKKKNDNLKTKRSSIFYVGKQHQRKSTCLKNKAKKK